MDGQRNFFCITEGEKARRKAMKIAVGLSSNKATFIYYITNFTTLKTLLFNLLIILVLVLKNCFPFVGVCDILRGGIISFERTKQGPNRGRRR